MLCFETDTTRTCNHCSSPGWERKPSPVPDLREVDRESRLSRPCSRSENPRKLLESILQPRPALSLPARVCENVP